MEEYILAQIRREQLKREHKNVVLNASAKDLSSLEFALQCMYFDSQTDKVLIYVQAYSKTPIRNMPRCPLSRKDIVNGKFKSVKFSGTICDTNRYYHHDGSTRDYYIELGIALDEESSKRWRCKVNPDNWTIVR